MDFFQHQEVARRKTTLLVLYYGLAVVAIIFAVYLAVTLICGCPLWDPQVFIFVAFVTLAIVGVGTLIKVFQLRQGGHAVAEMLGGRRVDPATTSSSERRLLNVVEEMAIASGTPVPSVYLLDEEQGLNAFAAGFNPSGAIIGVTQGSAQEFSRDELQGVIAHEFSHILNGDMRLNIRLIGVLFGILSIATIGFGLMRVVAFGGRATRGSRKGSGCKLAIALLLLGISLIVIGYIGVFFAKVIRSAVSRQREYLADAASVQFTRNPAGLANALKRIGGFTKGSKLLSNKAEEASHLFFANGVTSFLSGLLATHPPLRERIRRIDPSLSRELEGIEVPEPSPALPAASSPVAASALSKITVSPGEVMASIGAPQPAHLAYASNLIKRIPVELQQAAREPFGARAVIYSLLLDADKVVYDHQLTQLRDSADPAVYAETVRLAPLVSAGGPELRLPLAELVLPVLRNLSPAQYEDFRANVRRLVKADSRISLFEYTLQHTVLRHLGVAFQQPARRDGSARFLRPLKPACIVLLSALAHAGHKRAAEAGRSFQIGMRELFPKIAREDAMIKPSLAAVDQALDRLAPATPRLKRKIMAACVSCVVADTEVTREEAELLRAVGDSLDCPMPPLLVGLAN